MGFPIKFLPHRTYRNLILFVSVTLHGIAEARSQCAGILAAKGQNVPCQLRRLLMSILTIVC
jgi:hypothetical protein